MKKVETNEVFVREMLKSCNILAIRERWLFNFQLPGIEKRFPFHSAISKAIDENNILPST